MRESWAAAGVMLAWALWCIGSIVVTMACIYAMFHFIVKFW